MKKIPNAFQAWATAARLRTIPIPAIQVLTGTCLAYSFVGTLNWPMFVYTLLVAIFITIGTNLINDVIDFEKGGDSAKSVGFLKVISAGLISKEKIRFWGIACFVFAFLFAFPLFFHSGSILFSLILLSIVCGYCYTGGPYPISYLGLSELFILVFYGFVCVAGAFFVQSNFLSMSVFLCAMQMGLLAILPNALNNFRDIHEDGENGKFTLAVRFGKTFARWEITFLTAMPFIFGIGWIFLGNTEAAIAPMLLIPVAFLFVSSVWKTDPGPLFNRLFGLGVLIHFIFGMLLILGFFLKPVVIN